jgi:hypothetical protein
MVGAVVVWYQLIEIILQRQMELARIRSSEVPFLKIEKIANQKMTSVRNRFYLIKLSWQRLGVSVKYQIIICKLLEIFNINFS